ncbi:GNAT family N-acetyltransferase [Sulfidibacter corallicola]|uniref:GNAT family N-acetyltransferase n=1 Tax=Sulfidibacter corallicola TaxID=2818388 RepID=A0A8A4U3K3_SULCO|nr:GNAT family N-acetyltransferase [Sulfidibacter corallicola]QTD53325.1 GNAT family N-acetyltransferase [Sulfidibacter corallicola]
MLTLREATAEDVDTLYDLIIAIAEYHDQTAFVVTDRDELLQAGFGEAPQFGVLLAEVDGEIAGYTSYTWNYSIWLGTTYMNIDDVFVWSRFRGQKIGESMMLRVRDLCKARGVGRIRWEVEADNHKAIRFYERLGAEVTVKGVVRWDLSKEDQSNRP